MHVVRVAVGAMALAGVTVLGAAPALAATSPVQACATGSVQVSVNGQSVVNQSQGTCLPPSS